MTIESDTRCTSCGRCSLWCTCIGTFALPCVCEREEQGAADQDAKRDGAGLPAGMVGDLHAGSNLTTRERNHA